MAHIGIRHLIAFLLVAALAACGGKEAQQAKHLERGKQLYAEGAYDKASVELRNVLQINPNNGEAYYYFGLIEEHRQNVQGAFASFLKAAELVPANTEAQTKLARMYLFMGDAQNADSAAAKVLAVHPDDGGALVVKAAVMANKGETKAATELAEQLIARDPRRSDAVALLAGLHQRAGDADKAREVLVRGVTANPNDESIRVALITQLAQTKRFDDIEAQYIELIRIAPANAGYRSGLAQLYVAQGKSAQAEKLLRDAVAADPKDESKQLALAALLTSLKRAEDAQQVLRGALDAQPGAHQVRLALAALQVRAGQADRAVPEYERLIKDDANGAAGATARADLAQLRLQQGRGEEARTLVQDLLKINPRDNRGLMLRSQLQLSGGDAPAAIADLRSVLKDQPNSLDVLARLARAHIANKEPKLAVEVAGSAVDRFPQSVDARLLLAEARAGAGDRAGALEALDTILKAEGRHYKAAITKAGLQMSAREFPAALKTLQAARDAYPREARIPYLMGVAYAAQKDGRQAEASYEAALALAPGTIDPLTGLVGLHLAQRAPEKAVARVQRAAQERPKDVAVHALLGSVLAQAGDDAAAEAAYRGAIAIDPKAAGAWLELSNFYLAKNRGEDAVKALSEGLAQIPGDGMLSHRLATVQHRGGRFEEAIKAYESLLALNAHDDLAANNLANLLLDNRKDKASHERALELLKRFAESTNPAYVDSLGWAYYRLGKYDLAIGHLKSATQRAPNVPIFEYHYGMALFAQGDKVAAKPILEKVIRSGAQFPGIDEARQLVANG